MLFLLIVVQKDVDMEEPTGKRADMKYPKLALEKLAMAHQLKPRAVSMDVAQDSSIAAIKRNASQGRTNVITKMIVAIKKMRRLAKSIVLLCTQHGNWLVMRKALQIFRFH